MFAVGDIDAPAGSLLFPAKGVWGGRISLSTDAPPVVGRRVAVVAGSLSASGTVTDSGSQASASEVEVWGGAAGWRRVLAARPVYRDDALVYLSRPLQDLATATGETVTLQAGAERALGYAWTRPRGPACTALDELSPTGWWVDRAGVTHVGARPSPAPVTAPWTLAFPPSPASGWLLLAVQQEHLSAFDVGGVLDGEGLSRPFTIGALRVLWARGSVRIEVWRA